jgi:2-isopropylmalate synthase
MNSGRIEIVMAERVYLYDTTLRDGAQTQGVDFSAADKVRIARELDRLGIDYVEGGWPGANPTDDAFFANPPAFKRSRLTAFGMTRRAGRSADNDPGLNALLVTPARVATMVGKSWTSGHRGWASAGRNLRMVGIGESRPTRVEEVMFDTEHFFDGYKANPAYALPPPGPPTSGARWVVQCDTNGGTCPTRCGARLRGDQGRYPRQPSRRPLPQRSLPPSPIPPPSRPACVRSRDPERGGRAC